jgi:hypothetical protein
MRVVAASFPDDVRAHSARAKLLAELALEPQQVGVETLAEPGDGAASHAVVAGQFDDDLVGAARRLLEQSGGTVMLDIDATQSNA